MNIYREYDPETLKKLQKVELEILKDFADLCEKNNIDYFGMSGTALGMRRHGGFVPWDDDIDVGLTRVNYDKFMRIAASELNEKYTIITAESEENFPLMSTRMVLRGTRFKEDTFKKLDIKNGIFLDIYCFDNLSDNSFEMKKQLFGAWFWGKILILKYINDPVLYVKGPVAAIIRLGCRLVHNILNFFNVSKKTLYSKVIRYTTKYNRIETKKIGYMFDPNPFTGVVDIDIIEPTEYHDFDGIRIRFPGKIDEYLKLRYGNNYMELPPKDRRHNHPPYELKLPEQ